MASMGNEIRTFFLKGLQAIGDAAAGIGTAARQKLDEIRLENRRDELRRELPAAALEMWKDGLDMPQKLRELIEELNDLNAQLAALRAKPETSKKPTQKEEAAEPAPVTFEEAIDELEEKVDEAIEAVEDLVEEKAEQVKDGVKDAFTPEQEEEYEPINLDDSEEQN